MLGAWPDKTKSILIPTQVEVVVEFEAGVELGNKSNGPHIAKAGRENRIINTRVIVVVIVL